MTVNIAAAEKFCKFGKSEMLLLQNSVTSGKSEMLLRKKSGGSGRSEMLLLQSSVSSGKTKILFLQKVVTSKSLVRSCCKLQETRNCFVLLNAVLQF